MPEIPELLSRWWKPMLAVILLSLATAAIAVYLRPLQYLSVTTAVAGNALSADKSRIFSHNIEGLYADIGSPDELDKIQGTGQLDTIYLAITDQFNLFDHYKLDNKEGKARQKSAKKLKKNSRVFKSDFGELKVKVWDTDKNLAPQLANALMDKLQQIHQALNIANNIKILSSLQQAHALLQKKLDSLAAVDPGRNDVDIFRRKAVLDQSLEYEKLISQYQLVIDTRPGILLVTEKARAALKPDRPKRLEILIATAVLSSLFSLLLALVLESNKRKKK